MSKTAQALKNATISKTDSFVLMKNMVRISVSSICYMRDLFPPECFKKKQYGAMDIHQLQGAKRYEDGEVEVIHSEAFLLTQWLERGVFSALELEYLSAITFAIYTKHPKAPEEDLLLETYEFKVAYPESGVPMLNDVSMISKEAIKNQAAKFIRSLTEFAGTLDDLPNERWITLQLKYRDNAPKEYEPEFFRSADCPLFQQSSLPLVINVGNIKTPSMEMKVKFAGLESLLFEDIAARPTAAFIRKEDASVASASTAQPPTVFRGNACKSTDALIEDMETLTVAKQTHKEEEINERIKAHILQLGHFDRKLIGKELGIHSSTMKKSCILLSKEGFLRRRGVGYQLTEETIKKIQSYQSKDKGQSMEKEGQQHLSPDDASIVRPEIPLAPNKIHTQRRDLRDSDLKVSRVTEEDIEESYEDDMHSPVLNQPSTYGTNSGLGQRLKRKSPSDIPTPSNSSKAVSIGSKRALQVPDIPVPLSQTSEFSEVTTKRARKYSIIRDPIHMMNIEESH